MKKILGLDIGTNSIGWAIVEHDFENKKGNIIDMGSRILPMEQGEISDFNQGNLKSSTANRTSFRGVRRLIERNKGRRKRLLETLKRIGYIEKAFQVNHEHALAYTIGGRKCSFRFHEAYEEMLAEFRELRGPSFKVPHDWTIYYLRKKALTHEISKEELAWVILQFNTKRGYFQLRGDKSLETDANKYFLSDVVDNVIDLENVKRGKKTFRVELREDVVAEYSAKEMPDWLGKRIEFIVTEKSSSTGTTITLSKPDENDWTLRKKKSEQLIQNNNVSVGEYIYNKLLEDPTTKIRGKEVHTIDRKLYKDELERILDHQEQYHPELNDPKLLNEVAHELYKRNTEHRNNLLTKSIKYLIIEDILYYQRPLKSKKYLIANCKYEKYSFYHQGVLKTKAIKGIAKSHPLYEELRIWSVIHNLRILQKEFKDDRAILHLNHDVSIEVLTNESKAKLFRLFDRKKEVVEKDILKLFGFSTAGYRINYEEGAKLKGNETKSELLRVLKAGLKAHKKEDNPSLKTIKSIEDAINILEDKTKMEFIWHALYSLVEKEEEVINALQNSKIGLSKEAASIVARGVSPYKKEYGAYSKKAIGKLLSLMRCGAFWSVNNIDSESKGRIENIITGEEDDSILEIVRKIIDRAPHLSFDSIESFRGLSEWMASYIVYNRHSEAENTDIYTSPDQIDVQKLVPQHSLRNPTVEKVLRETLLVVQDIWKAHGKPTDIHVELVREMKLPNDKRSALTKRRNANTRTNERARAMLRELQHEYNNINPYSIGQQEMFKLYEEGAVILSGVLDDDIKAIRRKDDPTSQELKRYKLWLNQKYLSPYTGQPIPLSRLFTSEYEIEHIIPQSLYYDNSMNNKVICEREANKIKDNRTAYRFIIEEGGRTLQNGNKVLIKEDYEALVSKMYWQNKAKERHLKSYDIPTSFISSQLNNTRYITKKLLNLLDPVVRDTEDTDNISRHLISMVGGITHQLKRDWGLTEVWKQILSPRFERMNEIDGTYDYYRNDNGNIHLSGNESPLKRLDHRHHALDALIVACTMRQHIQYLNSLNNKNRKYELEPKIIRRREKGNNSKLFIKPWPDITTDTRQALEKLVISFKQSLRIINRTNNHYKKYVLQDNGQWRKKYVKQEKSEDFWSIRKPLHKETVFARVTIKEYKKNVSISKAIKNIDAIADSQIKRLLKKRMIACDNDVNTLNKNLRQNPIIRDGEEVNHVDMSYMNDQYAAVRKTVDTSFSSKVIDKIVDQELRRVLQYHLNQYNGDPNEAFSPNGLNTLNESRKVPIYKVRVKEDMGKKYPIGSSGQNLDKYVVAAKGTNLYFILYKNLLTGENSVTSDSTLGYVELIEIMKIGGIIVPEREGFQAFTLSPGDLVYVPEEGDMSSSPVTIDKRRIYKCVNFSESTCFFIQHHVSDLIVGKKEFSSQNKSERSWDGIMIKRNCIKLNVDRIGVVKQA
ncbi:MAG: CRISPR-associated endonuclease Csn1 [Saprospiraceae bacterium]|jgi:CRISPR-associated endonuclease Csn1